MNIYDALADAGIEIPFPQTDLRVRSFDPTVQKTILPFDKQQRKKLRGDEKGQASDPGDE